jgi:4-hydroxy-tetrahydrodipicolinate reductase
MEKIKIAVIGFGRTGKSIVRQILKDASLNLVAVVRRPNGKNIGRSVGDVLKNKSKAGIWSSEKLEYLIKEAKPDVFIDFSDHKATLKNLDIIANYGINIVIATTGFSDEELEKIKSYRDKIGIVLAPNITVGINILMELARRVAKVWPESDIEIIESHFRKKKDAPSGTAIKIANALGGDKEILLGKKGEGIKKHKEVVIHSIRAGGIIGMHEVMFVTDNQEITIKHESISRTAYADGAIIAAKWVFTKGSGIYFMKDVLDL